MLRNPYLLLAFAAAAAVHIASSAGPAQAATIGAEVGISSISPCPSFCGGSGATFDSSFDGGEGFDTAFTSLDNVATLGHGSGQARAEFSGPSLLPLLRGLSDAEPNARVSTSSTAYRLYNYSGPGTTIQLDVALSGNAAAPSVLDASIEATVVIVTGSDLPHSTHAPTFLFEIVPGTPGIDICGSVVNLSIDVNAGVQIQNGSAQCDVQDGDDFFVWSNLTTSGTRDGLAAAFDSLTAAWADPTGITVVPEPQTALLLLLGLTGLATSRRRKR